MQRYVAFLRAINVGGHVVKMDHLRKILESIGLSNVQTFIASGNAVFQSSTGNSKVLENKIAAELRKALGYEVATFIRKAAELSAISMYQPFKTSDVTHSGTNSYVGFVGRDLSPAAQKTVLSFRSKVDEFRVRGSEIYWLCRIRSSDSEFSLARLEKAIGMQATFRNVTTIRKMAARYAQPQK
jgi:uncharacterized protein (DUF1697 family)